MSFGVAELAGTAALRRPPVARNWILLLRLRICRFLRDSLQLTFTVPELGTVKRFVPRLIRRLALTFTFATD